MDVCTAEFMRKDPTLQRLYRAKPDNPRLHLNVDDLKLYGRGNQGLSLPSIVRGFFEGPGMESVCVYGVEGNPYFTGKLLKLNDLVNDMRPRPLKHLFIQTETIVSSENGPATLYLDQHSKKNHVSAFIGKRWRWRNVEISCLCSYNCTEVLGVKCPSEHA